MYSGPKMSDRKISDLREAQRYNRAGWAYPYMACDGRVRASLLRDGLLRHDNKGLWITDAGVAALAAI